MTLKDDDKPGTSQKYDKDIEANLALKDDVFDGLGDITHMEVDDFFGDRNWFWSFSWGMKSVNILLIFFLVIMFFMLNCLNFRC